MTMILPRRPVTVPLTKTPANTTYIANQMQEPIPRARFLNVALIAREGELLELSTEVVGGAE